MADVVSTQKNTRQERSVLTRLNRLALNHPQWPYWAGLCLAFEVLYRRLAAAETTLQGWFNSDYTFAADVYTDVFVNHFPLSGIKFAIAPAIFPDMVSTSLLMFLIHNAILATFLYGLLQFTLLVAAYMFCAGVVHSRERRSPRFFILMVAIFIVLYVSSIPHGVDETLFNLFWNSSHVNSFGMAVFCGACGTWLCFHRWHGRRAMVALAAIAGLSLLGTMSDLMFIPFTLVAFTLAVLVLACFGFLPPRRPWVLLVIMWTSSVLGVALVRKFFNSAGLGSQTALSVERITTAFYTFRTGFYSELSRGNWLHVAALLWLAAAAVLTFYLIRRRRVRRHEFKEMPEAAGRLALIVLFLVTSSVGSVIAIILLGISGLSELKDYAWSMHYQFPLFFGGVFGLALLADLALARWPPQSLLEGLRWLPAAASFFIPLGMLIASPKPAIALSAYVPPLVKALDTLAPRYGLRYGLGGFWQFRSVNLLSKAGLRVYPITSNLEPFHWLSNKYWYSGYPGSKYPHPIYNFIILDDPGFKIPREAVIARFGEPAAEAKANEARILVYNRPSDERFRNFFTCSMGLASLLHPLDKRGDQLALPGSCLPSVVGSIEGAARVARQGKTAGGFLSFGPYAPLKSGTYSATIRCKVTGPAGQHEADWDLGFFERRPFVLIGRGKVQAGQTEIRIIFSVASKTAGRPIEMRVVYSGVGDIRIENLVIEKMS